MASAGTITVGTTDTILFQASNDGGKATTIMVRNPTGSSNDLLVNVEGLHKAGEYVPIPAGDKEYFRFNNNGLGLIVAKVASGSQSAIVCVVAKITNI